MNEVNGLENKLIVFRLEGEEYAISVQRVGSIERILPITRVPSTPSFVKGVVNLRGVVTPVIDLKERFHEKQTTFTEQTRIIIVHIDDITVGLIVDEANDVLDIQQDQIEPAPEAVGSAVVEYISGVIKLEKRLFILLDLEKVLNKADMTELRTLEG
ncbi:chemotaxis protein CheW [Pseudogracilibacillus auburnensis]|uniref:Purine-binding chemotaxis protein CheW n=1 Tax=Pseudogracilibacillus auburnensis TaxID=1494959 RepID=A0A2V3WIK8_9BACI|nr:chemotaxis protein CheW [Pseudogracilibacillus auburnensis]PXW88629.1 purine-binding chemotaxis protein CheW [Pseudogracilibacillus auburnensis]